MLSWRRTSRADLKAAPSMSVPGCSAVFRTIFSEHVFSTMPPQQLQPVRHLAP